MMRWLARCFASALVRRVAIVVVSLVLAAIGVNSNAQAQAVNGGSGCRVGDGCDQGEAYANCLSAAAAGLAEIQRRAGSGGTRWTGYTCNVAAAVSAHGVFETFVTDGASLGNLANTLAYTKFYWLGSEGCATRNSRYPPGDMQPSLAQPPSDCYGGCKLVGTSVTSSTGGITIYGVVDRYYTGEVCAKQNNSNAPIDAKQEKENETKPKAPECTALGGGQTACQKPNGDQCATASTGKTFCWKPSETGKKIDGEDAQVKGKKGEPVTPPDIKIDDKDWQRTQGHQQTACINGTCITYNVTNYQTAPAGSAKNSTGDNNADGSGNTSGNGKPSKGDGDKEGEDSASESGNCDTAPACTGDTLKCLQLKFTWKIECNTKGNEITKGNGCGSEDVPVCVGKSCKAEAYSQLLQQWRQRCAAEGDRDAAGRDAASGAADASGDDLNGVVGRLWKGDGTVPSLDQGRVSVGGGPVIPEVDIMGTTFSIPQSFYDALAIIKKLIIASAMIAAFWILWNR